MTTDTVTKERPIPFTAEMVNAILAGRKTQTRRILKTQPIDIIPFENDLAGRAWCGLMTDDPKTGQAFGCRYGQPGDTLYIKETYAFVPATAYRASDVVQTINPDDPSEAAIYRAGWSLSKPATRWRGGRFMPKWVARIKLQITSIKVERLQDISDHDAIAEGITGVLDDGIWSYNGHVLPRDGFYELWKKIHGSDSWDLNPWLWAISFERITD